MENLATLLFLISIATFIVGMIKPSLFSRIFIDNRRKILIFSSCVFVISLVVMPKSEKQQVANNIVQPKQSVSPTIREAGKTRISQDSHQNYQNDQEAISLVAGAITSNELNLDPGKLLTKDNPKGKGTFVYYPETRFSGVERFVIWLVLDGEAYALNSPSKTATPDLKWPREAEENEWKTTGLDMYQATEAAIEMIFGK